MILKGYLFSLLYGVICLALGLFAYKLGAPKNQLKTEMPRAGELPFDSGRKMMSTVHPEGAGYVQYTKGAPDVVLNQCAYYLKDGKPTPMTEEAKADILAANKAMADKALRVLAIAERAWENQPAKYDSESMETELWQTFLKHSQKSRA